jgi:glycosyltransferase involved in cell wall biosynthesis
LPPVLWAADYGLYVLIIAFPEAIWLFFNFRTRAACRAPVPPVERRTIHRVVLEALAADVSVVATDRRTIRDTVARGECGFVLPEPVPEELAEAVNSLLLAPSTRIRFGEAARNRYVQRFTQDLADRSLADWLSSVLARDLSVGSAGADGGG